MSDLPVTKAKTLIRPWRVAKAQMKLFMRGLWAPSILRMGRTITYTDNVMIGPFVIRRHYVQISTEQGEIVYKTPHMTNSERKAFIRRVEAVRERHGYVYEDASDFTWTPDLRNNKQRKTTRSER